MSSSELIREVALCRGLTGTTKRRMGHEYSILPQRQEHRLAIASASAFV